MAAKNIAAVKVYMGSSTGNLLVDKDEPLKKIFSAGKMVVAHAESEAQIKANAAVIKDSHLPPSKFHLKARPNSAAASEVERAIKLAKDLNTKLHIAHASTREELEFIADAKKHQKVSCEATPHHLFLDADSAAKLGNFAKVNPPLRTKHDIAALWEAVNSGVIDMVATDHAPHLVEDKEQDYSDAPSGMPGLETMLPLLIDAFHKKRISLKKLIELTSQNPASVFKIRGKGSILAGFDADITLISLEKSKTIKNDGLFTKCKWSPFDGWKLSGSIEHTIVGGEIAFSENQIITKQKGHELVYDN